MAGAVELLHRLTKEIEPKFLRKKALAEFLGVSVRTLEEWMASSVINPLEIPGSRVILFDLDHVVQTLRGFQKSREIEANEDPHRD